MAISFKAKVVAPPHVLVQQVGGESVLLNLQTECYFGLDAVGRRMWEEMTKADSVDTAYRALLEVYDVDAERLRQDLGELIENLVKDGLLEVKEDTAA